MYVSVAWQCNHVVYIATNQPQKTPKTITKAQSKTPNVKLHPWWWKCAIMRMFSPVSVCGSFTSNEHVKRGKTVSHPRETSKKAAPLCYCLVTVFPSLYIAPSKKEITVWGFNVCKLCHKRHEMSAFYPIILYFLPPFCESPPPTSGTHTILLPNLVCVW